LKFAVFIGALTGLSFVVKSLQSLELVLLTFGAGAVLIAFAVKIIDWRQLLITFKRPSQ
jgi:hypothetical protein